MDSNILNNDDLREPQITAYHNTYNHFVKKKETEDAIIVLPTGVGKTGLMGILPFGVSNGRVLIITPQLTIKDGVVDSLNSENPHNFWMKRKVIDEPRYLPVVIDYEKDLQIEDLSKANFIIMNIHKLQERLDSSLINKVEDDFFDMIIIDEAHHSPADTWINTLKYFKKAKVIKLTGTPFRSDDKEITGKLIYKYKLSQAMANGYIKSLENIKYVPNELKLTIDNDTSKYYTVDEVYDELGKDDSWISRSVAYSIECSKKIVDESKKLLETKKEKSKLPHKIIAVACSIEHADQIASLYSEVGLRTTVIHSDLEKNIKEKNLKDIKNNRVDVVINVAMLGEGYDHKFLSIAAIFRPFRHPLPYAQFVGRILRIIPSEEYDTITEDNIGQIISHQYIYMDELWKYYKEQINECDTIISLKDTDLEIDEDEVDSTSSNNVYDISVGKAKDEGIGNITSEKYLDTELTRKAEEKKKEELEKAEELSKILEITKEEAIKLIQKEEYAKRNEYKRPELLAERMKKNIDQTIKEQFVPELLNKYNIEPKNKNLKTIKFLRPLEYKWIRNNNYSNDAMLAIYFNQVLRNEIGKSRKDWNNEELNTAYDYLIKDLYPYVDKSLESFSKLV
jgi:superfamily II DNA or RNA helicase